MRGYNAGTIIDFDWSPVPGATSYKVLRALASDGNFAEVPGMQYVTGWARDYNTVKIGEIYLYKLLAYYPNLPPGESQVLRVEVKPTPPGVGNLTATSPQPGTVVLHWTPAQGAQGYYILRGKGSEPMANITRAVPPLDLAGTAADFTDHNLWNGATYRYSIQTWYGGSLWGQGTGVEVKVGP